VFFPAVSTASTLNSELITTSHRAITSRSLCLFRVLLLSISLNIPLPGHYITDVAAFRQSFNIIVIN
jgi:hypothetical protein